jgi:Na+-translocating ferredoxin:NAD+ oxidoreductase RnfG subunit
MKTNLGIENKNLKKERNDKEKLENKINPEGKKETIEYLPPGYQKNRVSERCQKEKQKANQQRTKQMIIAHKENA